MSRIKTTVTLPRAMLIGADEVGRRMGLTRNGFIAAAVAMESIRWSRLFADVPKKRRQLLDELEHEFQILLADAKRGV